MLTEIMFQGILKRPAQVNGWYTSKQMLKQEGESTFINRCTNTQKTSNVGGFPSVVTVIYDLRDPGSIPHFALETCCLGNFLGPVIHSKLPHGVVNRIRLRELSCFEFPLRKGGKNEVLKVLSLS